MSPTWTSWGPANLRKVAFVCAAQARAIKVFPVPGGPYKSTPLGGRIPNFWNRSLCVMGKTMASTNSWICCNHNQLESPGIYIWNITINKKGVILGSCRVSETCLFLQPSNVIVVFSRFFINLHSLYSRIILGWQRIQDQVTIFVHTDQITRL